MKFSVNDSPYGGEEGKSLTSNMIRDRLMKEAETNVALQVIESENKEAFEVRGRGELQLGVLIETMRREGFELSVSPPRVVYKDVNGERHEPIEEVTIDVASQYTGTIIEKLSKRKAEMKSFDEHSDKTRIVFECPTRGLLGYSAEFKNDTSGDGTLNHTFLEYSPYKGALERSRKGSLVAMGSTGSATAYALNLIEPRGKLFIRPGDKVYAGMVIGESSRTGDLEVNPTRAKQVSNIRTVAKDENIILRPPVEMSLESMISYIAPDEVLEVTQSSLRIRKRELDANKRRQNLRSGRE
jgi:GTP-binding protein